MNRLIDCVNVELPLVLQALGSHEAASECLTNSDNILVSVSGSIAPGSVEEAKHRSLQDFWLKSKAAVEARLKDASVSLEKDLKQC